MGAAFLFAKFSGLTGVTLRFWVLDIGVMGILVLARRDKIGVLLEHNRFFIDLTFSALFWDT